MKRARKDRYDTEINAADIETMELIYRRLDAIRDLCGPPGDDKRPIDAGSVYTLLGPIVEDAHNLWGDATNMYVEGMTRDNLDPLDRREAS